MKNIEIEFKKLKRTGIIPLMLVIGFISSFYALSYFYLRKESLLSFHMNPTDVLLNQLYGMTMILNLFAIIVSTTLIYKIELDGAAMKKMYLLPISIGKIYLSKFIILSLLLAFGIAVEFSAFILIGAVNFGQVFDISKMLIFSLYAYITSMAVLSFMIFIGLFCKNIWTILGIGVLGFLSAMAFGPSQVTFLIINPFILMMKPILDMSANIDLTIFLLSLIEILGFLLTGLIAIKKFNYE